MKVCVLYSGLPRTYQFCLPNHFNSFWSKYQITDCFAHFWHTEGEIDNHSAPWSFSDIKNIPTKASHIIDAFKAKRIALEKDNAPVLNNKVKYLKDSKEFNFKDFTKEEILNQCLAAIKSNALSIRNVYNLVKDTNYDYYLLCRPDMLWTENLNCWPELNGKDNYYFWDTLWILKKEMLEKFANKVYNIEEYARYIIANNPDKEVQDYNFITSEAINELHFKKMGVDLGGFIPLKLNKRLHRGDHIQWTNYSYPE